MAHGAEWYPGKTSITLPPEVFTDINNSDVGLLFSVYLTTVLFPVADESQEEGFVVGSLVLGASLAERYIINLTEPVNITLELNPSLVVGHVCTYI